MGSLASRDRPADGPEGPAGKICKTERAAQPVQVVHLFVWPAGGNVGAARYNTAVNS
jgi:hypothetical protein